MRFRNFYKLGFSVVVILLLGLKPVSSFGTSGALPIGIKLIRNDSGKFFFSVFADDSPSDLTCTLSPTGFESLVVTFDEEEIIVPAGGKKVVYGSISVPADAPIKDYTGEILINCESKIQMETTGSSIKRSTTVFLGFSVVEKLEGVTTTLPKEEEPTIPTSAVFTIIIIVILVTGVGYWFIKKGKKKK